jgi:branched-chain amino acid aminotransferase
MMAWHYGQAVFEGMKVYRGTDGKIRFFRLDAHTARLNYSLLRMSMPDMSADMFTSMLRTFIQTDAAWIPNQAGTSFYVRPVVFATEAQVKVHPADAYTAVIFGCPSGSYYDKPLNLKVEETFSRAAPGGVGSTKTAGNYAASLYPTIIANKEGYDQVLWTDANTHTFVEESGTMNVMFVINGILVTPPLNSAILPGITRDSILTLANDRKIPVEERPISVDEIFAAHKRGTLTEAFGTGTAAVIAPYASITRGGTNTIHIAPLSDASIGTQLMKSLNDIRNGIAPDQHEWVEVMEG